MTPRPSLFTVRRWCWPAPGRSKGPDRRDLDLPELAALGIGALACAALTRRARRTRLLRQVTIEEPRSGRSPSPRLPSTPASGWRAGAGLPALHAFEAANYGVAAALADRVGGRRDDTGGLRWRGRGRLLAIRSRATGAGWSHPLSRRARLACPARRLLLAPGGSPSAPDRPAGRGGRSRDLAGPRRTGMHAPPPGRRCVSLVASALAWSKKRGRGPIWSW